jgi:hypothetical protein
VLLAPVRNDQILSKSALTRYADPLRSFDYVIRRLDALSTA